MWWIIRFTTYATTEYYLGGNRWTDNPVAARIYNEEEADAIVAGMGYNTAQKIRAN